MSTDQTNQQAVRSFKRREFIQKASVGAAAGGLLSACSSGKTGPAVQTQPRITWRLASSYPPSLDTIFGAASRFSKRVEELTEGRFRIRVYPAGELLPALQVMDGVQQGAAQMGHSASYYFIGKNPALAFDTTIPFGLTARQQNAWLLEGGGLDLINGLYSDFGIRTLPGGNTGVQMGGWFRNRVETLDDLKGLKMRIPGMGGEVMDQLGVTVQVLAGGDIFPALERGAIDATEWVGPYDDLKLGFHKAAKNYYYPGWWEPGPNLSFLINEAAWSKLPSMYQQAITVAAAEANQSMLARYDALNPPALQTLLSNGVQLRPFSKEIMDAAAAVFREQIEESASKDSSYRKVYDAWKGFRQESFNWFGTAESAYAGYSF